MHQYAMDRTWTYYITLISVWRLTKKERGGDDGPDLDVPPLPGSISAPDYTDYLPTLNCFTIPYTTEFN